MTQTALGKTTKEPKETFPAAGKSSHTWTTYVTLYQPGTKLTTDLDSVLQTGGFQVGVLLIRGRHTLSFKVLADFPEGKEMVHLSKTKYSAEWHKPMLP